MEQDDNRSRKMPAVFSKTIRAGRRRTYFFDVRTTRSNDYYITITESKKRFHEDGYDRHKVFLYKEDFNKFLDAMTETINHVKEELLPEYDFDEFSKNYDEESNFDDNFDEEKELIKKEEPQKEEEKEESKVEVEQGAEKKEEDVPPIDDEELKM